MGVKRVVITNVVVLSMMIHVYYSCQSKVRLNYIFVQQRRGKGYTFVKTEEFYQEGGRVKSVIYWEREEFFFCLSFFPGKKGEGEKERGEAREVRASESTMI